MKKALIFVLLVILLIGSFLPALAIEDPYSLQIKKLHAAPSTTAKAVFDIPVEVKLLDISEDANWYKVRISFQLGPFSQTHVGWAYIPVSNIIVIKKGKDTLPPVAAK